MTLNEYEELAQRTASCDTIEYHTLGLCSEAGEVASLVKKHIGQGHPMDGDKILEELGDTLWHLVGVCISQGSSLEAVAQMNIDKLKKRYPDGFSMERSINRK